jgi:hypothetical protein
MKNIKMAFPGWARTTENEWYYKMTIRKPTKCHICGAVGENRCWRWRRWKANSL